MHATPYPMETVRNYMAPADVRVASTSGNIVVLPSKWRGNRNVPGVLFVHSSAADAAQAIGATPARKPTRVASIVRSIALSGLPVVSVNVGTEAWANDQSLADVSGAVQYLGDDVGAQRGRVLLLGLSMGGQIALVWTASHRSSVAGVAGLLPVADLTDIYNNNRGGMRASIDASFGGTVTPEALQTRNPMALATAGRLANLPLAVWYGMRDTTVLPGTVQALVAAIGTSTSATAIPGTHVTSGPALPLRAIVDFLVLRSEAAPEPTGQ